MSWAPVPAGRMTPPEIARCRWVRRQIAGSPRRRRATTTSRPVCGSRISAGEPTWRLPEAVRLDSRQRIIKELASAQDAGKDEKDRPSERTGEPSPQYVVQRQVVEEGGPEEEIKYRKDTQVPHHIRRFVDAASDDCLNGLRAHKAQEKQQKDVEHVKTPGKATRRRTGALVVGRKRRRQSKQRRFPTIAIAVVTGNSRYRIAAPNAMTQRTGISTSETGNATMLIRRGPVRRRMRPPQLGHRGRPTAATATGLLACSPPAESLPSPGLMSLSSCIRATLDYTPLPHDAGPPQTGCQTFPELSHTSPPDATASATPMNADKGN